MLKVVGIAAVTKVGRAFCKEAESDTAAALLEMGGTCCALLAAPATDESGSGFAGGNHLMRRWIKMLRRRVTSLLCLFLLCLLATPCAYGAEGKRSGAWRWIP